VYVRQLQQELADQDKLKINQQTGYVEIEKPKTDLIIFKNILYYSCVCQDTTDSVCELG